MFKDSPASEALMSDLASPEAAAIWAATGGFLAANKNLSDTVYLVRPHEPITYVLSEQMRTFSTNIT